MLSNIINLLIFVQLKNTRNIKENLKKKEDTFPCIRLISTNYD